jgi:hypothetical protein
VKDKIAFLSSLRDNGGVKMKKRKDVINRLCNIQKEFKDAVVFRVGVKDNGKTIDIISADNTFSSKHEEKSEEIEVQLPDYIG